MSKPHFRHDHRGTGSIGRPGRGIAHRGRPGLARADRVLDRTDLQTLLLDLLKDVPQHGYELIRKIKSLSEGCYAPSPGMVYPTLGAMAEEGLVKAASEDEGRKSFVLTDIGQARAMASKRAAAAILLRLKALSDRQAQVHGPIARALANLDLVLGNLPVAASKEQVDQVVTLIDGVARQIERIS